MQRAAGCLLLLLLTLSASAPSAEEGFDRGKALYEHHCMGCHEAWAHSREGRKATGLADLRNRTRAWTVHSGLPWSHQEVEDVVDYLNRTFYRF